jgi:hypothetical protein
MNLGGLWNSFGKVLAPCKLKHVEALHYGITSLKFYLNSSFIILIKPITDLEYPYMNNHASSKTTSNTF